MKNIKTAIFYVLSVHALALLFMSLQRIVLLLCNLEYVADAEMPLGWTCSALLRGVWFDNVIACYVSFFTLVILFLIGLFNKVNKGVLIGANIFYTIVYTIIFAIGVADIPYFGYFFKHLNSSIFVWKEEGGNAMRMILQESSYYVFFLFFLISIILFSFLLFKLSKKLQNMPNKKLILKEYFIYIPLWMALVGLTILGARGRLGYNPIKTSQAYFCTNSFFNQLGINPTFYFIRNVIEVSEKDANMDNIVSQEDAIGIARRQLGVTSNASALSPITRDIIDTGKVRNMNVVIVMMESMSSDFLSHPSNVTPYLNELIGKSYYFENIYSAGNHTNHGVMATLCGLPSLYDRNPMKDVDMPICNGISTILQQKGYETFFFLPHEVQYDNMKAFFLENGIKEIYGQEDYPKSKVVNSFGVQDDYLFDFSVKKLSEKALADKPFFATILTVSNHPPYIVPDKFKSVSDDPKQQIVAFADDAIRQLMTEAQKQAWFDNTIFVFVADHGTIVGTSTYDMPLSYNHVPLIIYSPAFEDAPQRFSQLGGQIDIFPTIMGLLHQSYENNTLGVDLLKTNRAYIYFTSDTALGCIDNEFFYTYDINNKVENLYDYKKNNPENLISQYRTHADSMRINSAAMLQTGRYLLKYRPTKK